MKKTMAFILLFSTVLMAGAQQTVNDANAEKRNISAFSGIHVSGGIDIFITQGSEDAIAVSAAETKYRDCIRTEVRDGILTI